MHSWRTAEIVALNESSHLLNPCYIINGSLHLLNSSPTVPIYQKPPTEQQMTAFIEGEKIFAAAGVTTEQDGSTKSHTAITGYREPV